MHDLTSICYALKQYIDRDTDKHHFFYINCV